MAWLRLWHSYLSVFVAPTVIFLALTGTLQIFNLHEAHDGYQPPALIEKLSRLHKDQVFELEHPHPAGPATPGAAHGGTHARGPEHPGMPLPTLLLKWFLAIEALALIATTVLGVWIGLAHVQPARARVNGLLLAAGALIPLALILA